MTTAIRTGQDFALVETRLIYDIVRGRQQIDIYEGSPDGIASVLSGLQNYQTFVVDQDGPLVRASVTTPDIAEAPVWELVANFKMRSIAEHAVFDAVTSHDLTSILEFMQHIKKGASPELTGTGPALAAAQLLYQYLIRANNGYFTEEFVLRYTITVSNAVAVVMAYGNTHKTFTQAALLTPGISGIIIPTGIVDSMAQIPVQATSGDFHWTWLKMAPQSRQSQIGKVVITGEWWLNLWPLTIYPLIA